MIKLNLCILLILLSWTASFAQSSTDTTRCYGVTDLRKIALKLTEGQQCDTLLKIADSQLSNRDTSISILNKQITGYKAESSLKESIIIARETELKAVNLQLKKTQRKLLWTKVGWLSTSGCLVATSIYLLIR